MRPKPVPYPARGSFARFVADGINADNPFDQMPRPGFLGSDAFIEKILEKFDNQSVSAEIPKKLRPARSLVQIARAAANRDQATSEAYRTGIYTLTEIARHFGIHQSTASKIARREDYA